MSHTDDRRDLPMPVTGEVGSEGGSFADPTMQVETFREPEAEQRTKGDGGPSSTATYAIRRETVAEALGAHVPTPSVPRFPSEPPSSELPRQAVRHASWRSGVLGAAAGLAIGLLFGRRG